MGGLVVRVERWGEPVIVWNNYAKLARRARRLATQDDRWTIHVRYRKDDPFGPDVYTEDVVNRESVNEALSKLSHFARTASREQMVEAGWNLSPQKLPKNWRRIGILIAIGLILMLGMAISVVRSESLPEVCVTMPDGLTECAQCGTRELSALLAEVPSDQAALARSQCPDF